MKKRGVERSGRRGVVLLIVAGMMFVLFAFMGLALDVGYLQWSRRRAQTSADAAALAGAWALQLSGAMTTEGKAASAINGFTDGQSGVTVTINNPPSSGSYAADNTAVEAIVSQDAPSYFMRVLGYSTLPVRARGVAKLGYSTACVFALDPSAKSSLKFDGTSTVNLGCGAVAESTDSSAVTVGGNATINLTSGASIGAAGGYSCGGNCSSQVTPSGSLDGGIVPPKDPLSTLPMPAYTSQPCFDTTTAAMIAGPCAGSSSGLNLTGGTYQPGVYCGGITVNGGVTVTFSAGVYILAGGGGLGLSQGTITANGVTFYVTDTTGWPCTGLNGNAQYPGAVTVTSQANLTLSAPTTGTYAGVAIFENRNDTTHLATNNSINGGAGSTLDGAIYLPNSALSFAGSSDSSGYLLLIANTIDFVGNSTMSLINLPAAFANNNPAFKKWVSMAE
jgi:hypothetical protein